MATALEKIQEKLRQLKAGKKSNFAPEDGENIIRILKPLDKDTEFYKSVMVHFGLGPEHTAFGVCSGLKCPACKKAAKLLASSSEKKNRRGERIAASEKAVMWVYDQKANLKRAQTFLTTTGVLKQLLGHYIDSEVGDFTDPKTGFDIRIIKTGKKMKTRYEVKVARKPSRFKLWRRVKRTMKPMDEIYKPLSVKEMRRVMLEGNVKSEDKER